MSPEIAHKYLAHANASLLLLITSVPLTKITAGASGVLSTHFKTQDNIFIHNVKCTIRSLSAQQADGYLIMDFHLLWKTSSMCIPLYPAWPEECYDMIFARTNVQGRCECQCHSRTYLQKQYVRGTPITVKNRSCRKSRSLSFDPVSKMKNAVCDDRHQLQY